ncbi:MAG: hypothetical protein EHM78_17745 [Myxococcaceae bacterium]|nr:MAG: hypothetical protein EHM78_17745 [Myxococcaceae bacterium]
MKASTRPLLAWLLLCVVGCHEGGATQAKLKSTYEDFEQKARWGESAAVAQLLVPERRNQFLAARARDGKDLNITDIELLNVVTSEDGTHATAISRWRWFRLPSTSEQVSEATAVWVARGGEWQLESMQGGPYPDLAPR